MLDQAAQEQADREAEAAEASLVQMRAAKLASSAVEQDAVVQSVARAKALARQEDEERAVAQRNEAIRREKEAKEQEQKMKQARLKEVAEKRKQAAAAAAEAKKAAAEARAAKAREMHKNSSSSSNKGVRSTSATPMGASRPMMHADAARAAMSAEEERWHEREAEAAAQRAAVEAWRNGGATGREPSGLSGHAGGGGVTTVRGGHYSNYDPTPAAAACTEAFGTVGSGGGGLGGAGSRTGAGAGTGTHLRAAAAPFRVQQMPPPPSNLPLADLAGVATKKKELWPALPGTKSSSPKDPAQRHQQRQAAAAAAAAAEGEGDDDDADLAAALMASRREAEMQEARAQAEANCFVLNETLPAAATSQAVFGKEQPPQPQPPPPPQPRQLPQPKPPQLSLAVASPDELPWTCATCTLADNSPLALACGACGSERPPEAPPPPLSTAPAAAALTLQGNAKALAKKDDDEEEEAPATTWVCTRCTYANGADLNACEVCSADRDEETRHNKPAANVVAEMDTHSLISGVAPREESRRGELGGEEEGKRRSETGVAAPANGVVNPRMVASAEAAAEAAFAELSSSQRELALQLVANVGCSFAAGALLATEEFDLDCCLAADSSDLEEMGLHASDVAQVLAWAKASSSA